MNSEHCLTDTGDTHRIDRVLGFFSSRPNWDSPTPSPAGECVPPPLVPAEGHTCLRERGSQFGQGDRHCGTLGIIVLCEDTSWNQQVRETNVISSLLDFTDSFLIYKLLYVSVCVHISSLECRCQRGQSILSTLLTLPLLAPATTEVFGSYLSFLYP